jgi:O-antigen/teichoic acid export membrane protein
MTNTFDRVFRNFGFLLFSSLSSRVILAFITVYLARRLGPEAFGIIGFSQSFLVYFTSLTDLGLRTISMRDVSVSDNQTAFINNIFTTRTLLTVLSTSLYMATLYFVPFSADFKAVMALYGLVLLFTGTMLDWILLATERTIHQAVAEFTRGVAYAGLVILFVSGESDVRAVPVAFALGTLAGTLYLAGFLFRKGQVPRFQLNTQLITSSLKKAIPLGASQLMISFYYNLDHVMLGLMRSSDAVGFYSAAYKPINIAVLCLNLLLSALIPYLNRLRANHIEVYMKFIAVCTRISTVVVMAAGIGITLFAEPIVTILYGVEYRESVLLLQVLIWSFVLIGIRFLAENYIVLQAEHGVYLKQVSLYFCVNLFLNISLIPRFGAVGAGIATVVSDIVFGVLIVRRIPLPFQHALRPHLLFGIILMLLLFGLKIAGILSGSLPLLAIAFCFVLLSWSVFNSVRKELRTILPILRTA